MSGKTMQWLAYFVLLAMIVTVSFGSLGGGA